MIGIDTSFLVAFEIREHSRHEAARELAHAREVRVVPTGDRVGSRFLELLHVHHLGRKRLLDTLLAATYLEAGVHIIATVNAGDFTRFEGIGTAAV
jgi:predicted nucleic acid-binding protein